MSVLRIATVIENRAALADVIGFAGLLALIALGFGVGSIA